MTHQSTRTTPLRPSALDPFRKLMPFAERNAPGRERVPTVASMRGARFGIALTIGLAAGGLALWLRLSGRSNFTDFDQIWLAARALVRHRDPYVAVAHGFHMPFYYPLPAALVGLPFSILPIEWAGPAFVALGMALLAYGLVGRGLWALIALASWPALMAVQQCQWSPFFAAAALAPWLGWLTVAKPSTGAITAGAYFSARWFWFNLAIGAALLAAAFALWPAWLPEWLNAVRGASHFVPLVLRPGGAILLLALLRWRLPEARLLALAALVPQTGAVYDALLVTLIPATRREALAFGLLSFAAVPFLRPPEGTGDAFVRALERNQTVCLLALYLPALVTVLLRKSRGGSRPTQNQGMAISD